MNTVIGFKIEKKDIKNPNEEENAPVGVAAPITEEEIPVEKNEDDLPF